MIQFIKKKRFIILFFLLFFFFILILCSFHLKKEEQINSSKPEEIRNPVSAEKAESLYYELLDNCPGIYIGNNRGIKKFDASESNCVKSVEYQTKLIGYSYESENVLLYINVIEVKDNRVYDYFEKDIGKYEESEAKQILEKGTTLIFTYEKCETDYKPISVHVMNFE